MKNDLYFQKQGIFSNKCALHAVNNLIGSHQNNLMKFVKYYKHKANH